MSGRVRWEQSWDRVRLADPPCGRREQAADLQSTGRWYAHDVSGGTDAPALNTRRRSDAKRWLLARAAGLAEVPRGPKFAQTAHGRKHGLYCENHRVTALPRGWRRAGAEVVHQRPYWIYERNRRRR